MNVSFPAAHLSGNLRCLAREPRLTRRLLGRLSATVRGFVFGREWHAPNGRYGVQPIVTTGNGNNPLRAYFDANTEGPGIRKWAHYFDIYHRHFQKFIGAEAHILEVGVCSGGSLGMWRHYLGPRCHVYGVDSQPACKVHENVKTHVPGFDIIVDAGGHRVEQQIVTLEELLPHVRPGGVYVCEDIDGRTNRFASYVHGLASHLNARPRDPAATQNGVTAAAGVQASIHSVHLYPFMTVIEVNAVPPARFTSERRGTEWQPFR
jgi:hypothetical protein